MSPEKGQGTQARREETIRGKESPHECHNSGTQLLVTPPRFDSRHARIGTSLTSIVLCFLIEKVPSRALSNTPTA